MANKPQEENPDFRFLVRIVNTDLDGKKKVSIALRGIPGINDRLSRVVAREAGVDTQQLIGNLSDEDIKKLGATLERVVEFTPEWMRNRRHDPESGEDAHLIGTEISMTLREDLNRLKKIRSWKGMRHEHNLPVRGQRTKSNGRSGATVGVQRKKK